MLIVDGISSQDVVHKAEGGCMTNIMKYSANIAESFLNWFVFSATGIAESINTAFLLSTPYSLVGQGAMRDARDAFSVSNVRTLRSVRADIADAIRHGMFGSKVLFGRANDQRVVGRIRGSEP